MDAPPQVDNRPEFKRVNFVTNGSVKLIQVQILRQTFNLLLSTETNKLILFEDPYHRTPKSEKDAPSRPFLKTGGMHYLRTEIDDNNISMRVYSAPIAFPNSSFQIPQAEIYITEYEPSNPLHIHDGFFGIADVKFESVLHRLLERSKIFSFQNSISKNELAIGGYWPIKELPDKRSCNFPMVSRNPFSFKFSKVILHESSGCTKEFHNGVVILEPSNAFIEIPVAYFVQNLYLLEFVGEDENSQFLVPLKRYHDPIKPLNLSYSRHNYRPNKKNQWVLSDKWTDLFYDRVHDLAKNEITYHEWRPVEYDKFTPAESYKHGDCSYRKIFSQKMNNQ